MNKRLEIEGKRLWKQTLRWVSLPIGVVLFVIGAILFPLPIPVGAILMVLGLFIAAFNPLMLRRMRRLRKRFPKTSAKIRAITPYLPGFLRRFLQRTDVEKLKRKDLRQKLAGKLREKKEKLTDQIRDRSGPSPHHKPPGP